MSREYPDRPVVGVGAVVVRDGEVLLIRRGKPPRQGQWSLPGGAQQLGETLDAAVVREVSEETGIVVEIVGHIETIDAITRDDQGGVRYHYTLFDVAARWIDGEPRPGSDAVDARFVPLDELARYDLWAETERVIALGHAMLTG